MAATHHQRPGRHHRQTPLLSCADSRCATQVYYMHLLFKTLGQNGSHCTHPTSISTPTPPHLVHLPPLAGSLTLLHLRLSEFVVERGARALVHPDIYHKLKRPERFEWIRARPQLLQPRADPWSASPRCEPLRRHYQRVAKVAHCCENWTWCDYIASS